MSCRVGCAILGKPMSKCRDDFRSSHENYTGDHFSLLLQFLKHFELMSFDAQGTRSEL